MNERLFQLRFNGELPVEVTPRNFRGLRYKVREEGRFVREVEQLYKITSPSVAAQYFMEKIFNPFDQFKQEEVWLVLVDMKNTVTHEVFLYRGTLNSSTIRVAEVFRDAIKHSAAGIIMAHNHPSGDSYPSPEDYNITEEIIEAAILLDISLLDHIIIGRNQWHSLKEQRRW